MRVSVRDRQAGLTFALALGLLWYIGNPAGPQAVAQSSSPADSADLDSQLDPYQRTGLILYSKLMGKSGWQRGQNIYYTKCWICHNDNTIKADPQGHAPTLKELYKRSKMITGQAINDETVAAKIRDGGPRMPAYRHGLTDQDIKDLVDYLREKCCWDENNLPANPRYKPQ